jgi:sulfur carrier protein
MKILVNGQPIMLSEKLNLSQLLEQRGLASAACAVEVNRELVPKRQHEMHVLGEGDCVEIVTLVGGG